MVFHMLCIIKHFEETRIKEMAIFINEKNYYIKSNNIISNLFDLADFLILEKI